MQHALAVGVVDGVADLARVVEGKRQIQRPVSRDDRFERLARHELHHDEVRPSILPGGVDLDDVGMIKLAQRFPFANESSHDFGMLGNQFRF